MKPLELSPEDFLTLAAAVVALSAEFLSSVDTRPIFPRTSGAEAEHIFALDPPEHEALRHTHKSPLDFAIHCGIGDSSNPPTERLDPCRKPSPTS